MLHNLEAELGGVVPLTEVWFTVWKRNSTNGSVVHSSEAQLRGLVSLTEAWITVWRRSFTGERSSQFKVLSWEIEVDYANP